VDNTCTIKKYAFFIYCLVMYINTADWFEFYRGMGFIFRGDFPEPIVSILTLNFRVDVTTNLS